MELSRNTLTSGTGLYLKPLHWSVTAHYHVVSAPSSYLFTGLEAWLRIVSGLILYLYLQVFPVAILTFRTKT